MKLYLNLSTAGRYGGGLNGNLRYLTDLIQAELSKSGFTSSFNEFWLTLAYPPMYVLPGVVGMEKDFKEFYDKFPYSRLDRRNKKVDITLQAPEFSEHLDKEEQSRYMHKFEIEDKYKNLSEVDLARVLLDKWIQVGQIIDSKTKKDDDFDFEKFQQVLLFIKGGISKQFLEDIHAKQAIAAGNDALSRALKVREDRKSVEKPKDKKIRDLRVYHPGLPEKGLYPYSYQYAEIFLNLLRRNELICPGYHHLYIQVVKTFEEGLRNSISAEDWYTNGISVFDYEAYCRQDESGKGKMVVEAIAAGLNDIAMLDKLDTTVIKKVTEEIRQTGLETELVFNKIESSRHTLRITYLSRSMEEECPIFFQLTDKQTSQSNKIQIGRADNSQIYFWLQKVTLTKDKIKIRSSSSVTANVWLKDKPREMEFRIADMLT
ncbi:hypothetical protein SAMN04488109_2711 [Chryseolinea serpens]|uniref:Uncharacterized protein n=1 Tax=Chryseolinea serpens TaxID=947013 RepID=A0A1M5P797_9BACT|nr:hypothetical protein [Chryseolinea serpens]SHG97575.1 hypothetical protein SAMN04488109_2711 [Chryseolinea serpens]